jgi:cardiolipin synthase
VDVCQLFMLEAINSATERLWIASPYFVPGPAIAAALQSAAIRGVDVRILLPQNPDHILVYLAAFSYYEEMDRAGVSIHRYQPGFMHQKVVLIDGTMATVGTVNLDNRSFHLNFELTVLVADGGFAGQVKEMLERDFALSKRASVQDFTKRSVPFRLAVQLCRLLAPIL